MTRTAVYAAAPPRRPAPCPRRPAHRGGSSDCQMPTLRQRATAGTGRDVPVAHQRAAEGGSDHVLGSGVADAEYSHPWRERSRLPHGRANRAIAEPAWCGLLLCARMSRAQKRASDRRDQASRACTSDVGSLRVAGLLVAAQQWRRWELVGRTYVGAAFGAEAGSCVRNVPRPETGI